MSGFKGVPHSDAESVFFVPWAIPRYAEGEKTLRKANIIKHPIIKKVFITDFDCKKTVFCYLFLYILFAFRSALNATAPFI